jgi:hypothetical protein
VPTMTIAATGTTTIQVEKSSQEANKLTLVHRAQRGDGDAFAEVFELFKGRIYRLCLSMTKNVSEAEDLTQEAFLQAFRNVGTFRGDSAFSTWLYRVAQNTVLMEFRRSKGPPMLSLDEQCWAFLQAGEESLAFMRFRGTSTRKLHICCTAPSAHRNLSFTRQSKKCDFSCLPSGCLPIADEAF